MSETKMELVGQNLRMAGILCILGANAVMLVYISAELGISDQIGDSVVVLVVIGLLAYITGMFNQNIPDSVRDLVGGSDD